MDLRSPRLLWLRLFGRLKPGVTLERARASIKLLWPRILDATPPPGYEGEQRERFFARRIKVDAAANGVSFLRKRFAYPLAVLMGLVGAVLLIACLNLANLTLAQAAARQQESAVRSALGAGVWDLMRPALTESLILSGVGAALGVALAWWASRLLLSMAWTGLVTAPLNPTPDIRVLGFTAGLALASAVLFAAIPALYSARTDPIEALRQQSRSIRGGTRTTGKLLLVAQTALSVVLVAGAFLFIRNLNRLHTVDAGYRRDHLLIVALFPQPGHRGTPNGAAYFQQLATEMKALPGVESVTFSEEGPANEFEDFQQVWGSLAGSPLQAVSEVVGPNFFHTMGMKVMSGREFDWHDDDRHPAVAILSQSLAEKLFGRSSAIGRVVYYGPHSHANELRVVGVVNSASLWKVESSHPFAIYSPTLQGFPDAEPLLDVRTIGDARNLKSDAERAVRRLGRHFSLRALTIEERLDSRLSVQKITAILAGFFGAVALLIAAIGLYGLMSFHVARRTSELGIRLALGAEGRQVLSMIMRESLGLADSRVRVGHRLQFAAGSAGIQCFIRGVGERSIDVGRRCFDADCGGGAGWIHTRQTSRQRGSRDGAAGAIRAGR